jgi:Spy/CpxP family protein refolding chaperone
MTRNRLLTLASFSLFCGSALAQSTTIPAPPLPPSDTPAAKARAKSIRDARNVQFGVVTGGEPIPRADLRIAPPGMWWKDSDIVQKLSLTADQQKRMDDIFQQSRLQLIDLKANVEKQEVMLEPMLSANPPDTNKVLGQIDKVASARAELEKANAKMLLGIRGILSADQWTKLQAEQRENRRMMLRFNPGPGGPGLIIHGPDDPKGPGGPESFKGPNFFYERGLSDGPHGPLSMTTVPEPPFGAGTFGFATGEAFGFATQEPLFSGESVDIQLDDDLDL